MGNTQSRGVVHRVRMLTPCCCGNAQRRQPNNLALCKPPPCVEQSEVDHATKHTCAYSVSELFGNESSPLLSLFLPFLYFCAASLSLICSEVGGRCEALLTLCTISKVFIPLSRYSASRCFSNTNAQDHGWLLFHIFGVCLDYD